MILGRELNFPTSAIPPVSSLDADMDAPPVMNWSLTGNVSSACPTVLFDLCFCFSLHSTPNHLEAPKEILWLRKIGQVQKRGPSCRRRHPQSGLQDATVRWGGQGQLCKGCGETNHSFLTFIPDTSQRWRVRACASVCVRDFRGKDWSRLPFPFWGNLPDRGIEHTSLTLAGGFFTKNTSLPTFIYKRVHHSPVYNRGKPEATQCPTLSKQLLTLRWTLRRTVIHEKHCCKACINTEILYIVLLEKVRCNTVHAEHSVCLAVSVFVCVCV